VQRWAPDWTPLRDRFPAWARTSGDLFALLDARFDPSGHGDMPRWQTALAALPDIAIDAIRFDEAVTVAGRPHPSARATLESALREFVPWRKGPFSICGVDIDTEWRSDWKWRRVVPHLGSLAGRRILDVGCGNGYFGWRMLGAGAELVVGIDPTLLFCMQHRAVNRYVRDTRNWVLPLRLEEFPATPFDTVFSMGVVYHRRDPLEHVEQLVRCVRPGGMLVLESLVVTDGPDLRDPGRYARMRNVWTVPAVDTLVSWLVNAGLEAVQVVDVTRTTTAEQRSTAWMPFESLEAALDPTDPRYTVEGHPAPVRAVVVARKPG